MVVIVLIMGFFHGITHLLCQIMKILFIVMMKKISQTRHPYGWYMDVFP
jgi:hypothetical protein